MGVHGSKQERRLDNAKVLRLGLWLQTNRDAVQDKTLEEIARMGQADLAFPIPPSGLRKIMEAAGVPYTAPRSNPLAEMMTRCKDAIDRIEALEARVKTLEDLLGK